MKDFTVEEFRELGRSYQTVCEALARPNAYKMLTAQEAEALAQLSPSYKSPTIWGDTSNWICSTANRMMKYRNLDFMTVAQMADGIGRYITLFEKFGRKLGKNIDSFKTFDDLKMFIDEAIKIGRIDTSGGLTQTAKSDGRARQCYSYMMNGGNDFVKVYSDDNWLIGYPTNLEYNKKFASIGKWCHTGSFDNAEAYWGEYAQEPIFYILNLKTGVVLCASKLNGGEVRDQNDNYPEGFERSGGLCNWNEYFTNLGLKTPMVDNIETYIDDYEIPDDAIMDVYQRVDTSLIESELFNDMSENIEYENSMSGPGGDVFFHANIDCFAPYEGTDWRDGRFNTRYAKDVDETQFYNFQEFKTLCKETYARDEIMKGTVLNMIINSETFKYNWNDEYKMTYFSYNGNITIEDDKTMADRMTIPQLFSLYQGNDVYFGYDSRRKIKDIRTILEKLVGDFISEFNDVKRKMFNGENNTVDIYGDTVSISIDADKADHIAHQIDAGECEVKFEGKPDIVSYILKGKKEFAMPRIDINRQLSIKINNAIAYIKYICKNPKDLEGQMHLPLKDSKGYPLFYDEK